jgi:hypothetical protein
MLRRSDFGEKWHPWIAHHISSMLFCFSEQYSYGFFSSSHGLRQRDPLSLLLFVIVMVALGYSCESSVVV